MSTPALTIVHGDQRYPVASPGPFVVGRRADLTLDGNPHLHRRLLQFDHDNGVWWVSNIGQAISVSMATDGGQFQAVLGPGARMPLVFPSVRAMFTAGPVTYELSVECPGAVMTQAPSQPALAGDETQQPLRLSESQRLLVAALAEEPLRNPAGGLSSIPTSAAAAERLGWPITTFNRKLDAVCDKLDRAGIDGLRGGPGHLATNRKARLVEYALLARLVTEADLVALDRDDSETSDTREGTLA